MVICDHIPSGFVKQVERMGGTFEAVGAGLWPGKMAGILLRGIETRMACRTDPSEHLLYTFSRAYLTEPRALLPLDEEETRVYTLLYQQVEQFRRQRGTMAMRDIDAAQKIRDAAGPSARRIGRGSISASASSLASIRGSERARPAASASLRQRDERDDGGLVLGREEARPLPAPVRPARDVGRVREHAAVVEGEHRHRDASCEPPQLHAQRRLADQRLVVTEGVRDAPDVEREARFLRPRREDEAQELGHGRRGIPRRRPRTLRSASMGRLD